MLHHFVNTVGSALLLFALVAAPASAAAASEWGPTANPDFYVAGEDQSLIVPTAKSVLRNDVGAKRAVLAQPPLHGTLTLNADGSFTYEPAPGYSGWDGFTYHAAISYFLSPPTPVYLYVNATPVAVADEYDVGTTRHFVVPRPGLLANDTDQSTFGLAAELVAKPLHGKASVGGFGRLDYRPTPGYTGIDTLTYRARNSYGVWSAPTTVTLHVTSNSAPTGGADFYQVDEDSQIEEVAPGLLANDTDPDGDPLVAELVSQVTSGEIDLRPDGSFAYSTDLNDDGDVSFTYRVGDGGQWSAPVLVSIDVIAQNDPPVAENDYYGTSTGATHVVPAPGVLVNDSDPIEFDGLFARLLTEPATGTVTMQPDGGFTMVLDPGEYRFDAFSYEACDPGGCATGEVTLEIFD